MHLPQRKKRFAMTAANPVRSHWAAPARTMAQALFHAVFDLGESGECAFLVNLAARSAANPDAADRDFTALMARPTA
jgi:hypothetical protein